MPGCWRSCVIRDRMSSGRERDRPVSTHIYHQGRVAICCGVSFALHSRRLGLYLELRMIVLNLRTENDQ